MDGRRPGSREGTGEQNPAYSPTRLSLPAAFAWEWASGLRRMPISSRGAGGASGCVADGYMAGRLAADLETKHGITTATLTKDCPQGGGEVHIGTMHRFRGLE